MKNSIVKPPNISQETKQAMFDFFVKHSLPRILEEERLEKQKAENDEEGSQ
ncbi:hypothetical protein [Psychrobacillus glaciei]|uniref:hypothetical protein n=1 Tax=Psychrobacillus glaciei TaxID=2283160 RepID=UPI00178C7E48|nr:hypothetical protein [Psychrobacillus glaciei]